MLLCSLRPVLYFRRSVSSLISPLSPASLTALSVPLTASSASPLPIFPSPNPVTFSPVRFSRTVRDIPEFAKRFDPESRVFAKPKNRNIRKRINRAARRRERQEFYAEEKRGVQDREERIEQENEEAEPEIEKRNSKEMEKLQKMKEARDKREVNIKEKMKQAIEKMKQAKANPGSNAGNNVDANGGKSGS